MTDRARLDDLGMTRRIPRRDFLNGLAVTITGAVAAQNVTAAARWGDAPYS
ncbi:MAG TPA: hypothetical protein VNG89_20065 [Vicinamibacterales bacterium]|nr:hypothetical protein [Vicinamibacterales bacterium]